MRSESVSGRWDKENNGPGFAGWAVVVVLAGAMGGPVRARLRSSYPRRSCGETESRLEPDDVLIFLLRYAPAPACRSDDSGVAALPAIAPGPEEHHGNPARTSV